MEVRAGPKEGCCCCLVTQSCLTLCDPMDCSLPGSSVHGILQARILEWTAIPFSNKEGWVPKNWCSWIVVLGKTLESPLDYKETKPVNPKENSPWMFIGKTDAEVEPPILLSTWCKKPIHWKRPWCWERLKVKEEGGRGRDSITDSVDINLNKLQETAEDRGAWRAVAMGWQRVGHDLVTEQQQRPQDRLNLAG